jgi:GT2 family glycosyltransferase
MAHPHTPRPIADPETPVVAERLAEAPGWEPAWVQSLVEDAPLDVSVCIANWNCRTYLRDCLESLHDRPQGVRLETIVVDNASEDGAADMVARDFPEVRLVRNATNRGFARANNQAAAHARGRYLFFLNNDTVVPVNVMRRLLDFAEANPGVGMIGPRLRDGHGHLQISYRQRPTMAALLHRTALLRWTRLLRGAYYQYRRASFCPDERRVVEVLMGAAVFMPREVFFGCGGWDEGFEFGGEDIDLSRRVGRTHPIVYVPSIEITHHGRVSTRQNISFTTPNVAIGYVHCLRKEGYNRTALLFYKLLVTLDAPIQLVDKAYQYAWRKFRRRHDKAEKSRLAIQGLWQFVRHEMVRFWKS